MDYLRKITSWLTDLLFPAKCLGCSAVGTHLCRACVGTLKPRHNLECVVCKRLSHYGRPCPECSKTTTLDQLVIAGHTDDKLLMTAVHRLKYSYSHELAPTLADWALSTLARQKILQLALPPLIVPVPLHPRRLRERGFNQAELLARRIAQVTAFSMSSSLLSRRRNTTSQVKARSRWERLDNMRDAFACNGDVADRDILLVDDVCTTGATLEDCARALKDAGAVRVIGLVLARG